MYQLKFDQKVCASCRQADCLLKCQYMTFSGHKEAHGEMMKIMKGRDSRVLHECTTCYACEEYCQRGNHPFYLISEQREEKGIFAAPRPITNQWINMTVMQGKYLVGNVEDKALSCCYIPELGPLGSGEIFKDVADAGVFGTEFMCPAVHSHFARMSVIKERLPLVIENYSKLGVKEVICLHDECYGTLTSIAGAYGMEVPFKPVYYMDFLLERMKKLKDKIKPLNMTVAYQRPCSNRLIPDKHPLVKKIFRLIGVKEPKRTYQDETALCCAEIMYSIGGYELADDVQKRNIDDMLATGAEYCVFNCPACQTAFAQKVEKRGLKTIHIIDLCKMAIGEIERGTI